MVIAEARSSPGGRAAELARFKWYSGPAQVLLEPTPRTCAILVERNRYLTEYLRQVWNAPFACSLLGLARLVQLRVVLAVEPSS